MLQIVLTAGYVLDAVSYREVVKHYLLVFRSTASNLRRASRWLDG
jgi:hypothetical protein